MNRVKTKPGATGGRKTCFLVRMQLVRLRANSAVKVKGVGRSEDGGVDKQLSAIVHEALPTAFQSILRRWQCEGIK